MYYRLELWYDWSKNAKNGIYELEWGCAKSTTQSGGTWTPVAKQEVNGKKHIEITDTSATLDIVVYDTSPASQASTSISTLTLTFQAVPPTTGDIFEDEEDEDTLANGASTSDFTATTDLDVVTDNGNKQAKAGWTFNKGTFENLNNGSWTFTGTLVSAQGNATRPFTFDPEIDINM